MTYTAKPGSGAIFRNERKTAGDQKPDYRGSLTLPDGSTLNLGGWVTQGQNGKYLSLKVSTVLQPVGEPEV